MSLQEDQLSNEENTTTSRISTEQDNLISGRENDLSEKMINQA